jgi:hypothetical protein
MGLLTKMTVGYGGNDDNSNKRTYTGDHAINYRQGSCCNRRERDQPAPAW